MVCGEGESIQCCAENHMFDRRLAICAPTGGEASKEFKFPWPWPAPFACIWREKAGSFASVWRELVQKLTIGKPSNFDQSCPDPSIRQRRIQLICSEAIIR